MPRSRTPDAEALETTALHSSVPSAARIVHHRTAAAEPRFRFQSLTAVNTSARLTSPLTLLDRVVTGCLTLCLPDALTCRAQGAGWTAPPAPGALPVPSKPPPARQLRLGRAGQGHGAAAPASSMQQAEPPGPLRLAARRPGQHAARPWPQARCPATPLQRRMGPHGRQARSPPPG
jgi:hypothetical protein